MATHPLVATQVGAQAGPLPKNVGFPSFSPFFSTEAESEPLGSTSANASHVPAVLLGSTFGAMAGAGASEAPASMTVVALVESLAIDRAPPT